MKKVIYYIIPLIFTILISVGEVHSQNVNTPFTARESKRVKKGREKPERPIVKKKSIPVKNIRILGKWVDFAIAFDDTKGTSINDPIEITRSEQLAYLAKQVNAGNNYAGIHFKLMNDIQLGGFEWTPIGQFGKDEDDISRRFCGIFNGNGHKIEKLTITKGDDYAGLFGICGTGSHIEKLHVVDCYVSAKMIVGGLVGELINGSISECSVSGNVIASSECVGGIAGINNGTIVNSRSSAEVFCNSASAGGIAGVNGDKLMGVIDNCQTTGLITGFWNVGGLAGRNHSTISNCQASGNVNGEEWIGGLVGWTDKGTIIFCKASGNVSGFFDVGGLVGFNGYLNTTVQIVNSHATGKVTGVGLGNNSIGGLAGFSGGIIDDCSASGIVEGEEAVGGLIGEHGGKTINSHASGNVNGVFDVGGMIGNNGYPGSKSYVDNCFATGKVTGIKTNSFGIGGLAGYSGGTIIRCYATGTATGWGDNVGGLVGELEGTLTDCYASGIASAKMNAGGLVGWNWSSINNCYATGWISCDINAGGLIGHQDKDATVTNSYFDWQTTKQVKGIGLNNNSRGSMVKPLTTEVFKSGNPIEGFDHHTIWDIVAGQYPKLKTISVKLEDI